jgi:hypothetical protein
MDQLRGRVEQHADLFPVLKNGRRDLGVNDIPHPNGNLHTIIKLAGCLTSLNAGANDAGVSRGNCGIPAIGIVGCSIRARWVNPSVGWLGF